MIINLVRVAVEGGLWKIPGRGMNTECEAGLSLIECITHSGGEMYLSGTNCKDRLLQKVRRMLLLYIQYLNNLNLMCNTKYAYRTCFWLSYFRNDEKDIVGRYH